MAVEIVGGRSVRARRPAVWRLAWIVAWAGCTPIGPIRELGQAGAMGATGEASPTSDAGRAGASGSSGGASQDCSDGALRCVEVAGRARMICQAAHWTAHTPCSDKERCESMDGPRQGECQPIATECATRKPGVPYCDGDERYVCDDQLTASPRPCEANERCRTKADEARCGCVDGTADLGAGCEKTDDCTRGAGGCDELTDCIMGPGGRSCTECPPGFDGTGLTGCVPLLTQLTLSCGQLSPQLARDRFDYRVTTSILCQRLKLKPMAAQGVQLQINGAEVSAGVDWASDLLGLGDNAVNLTLAATSGVTTQYHLTISRNTGQEAYIKADYPHTNDLYGFGVGISGDTIVVGAPHEDGASGGVNGDESSSGATDSGAAYVYVRQGTAWVKQGYLKAESPVPYECFGAAVAITQDMIIVGAPAGDPVSRLPSATRRGAAYVFVRENGTWSQRERLVGTASAGDMFGLRVLATPDRVFVGAPTDARSGAAYVFTREATGWGQPQKLTAATPLADSWFGYGLTLEGDTLVVGAYRDGSVASEAGSAHVFTQNGAAWTPQQRVQANAPRQDASFGFGIGLLGDTMLVGAPRVAFSNTTPPGEVYVFQRGADGWGQTEVLQAPMPRDSDYFGGVYALTPDYLLLSASGDASSTPGVQRDSKGSSELYSGALHLYARQGRDFVRTTFIKASNPQASDAFGADFGVSGDTIVSGAAYESGDARGINGKAKGGSILNSGAIYVFR